MRNPNYDEQKNLRSIDYKGFATSQVSLKAKTETKKVKLQLNEMPHSRTNEKDLRDANYRGFMNLL